MNRTTCIYFSKFVVQVLYFYNKTCKYDNVRVAPRTLDKAVLNVSFTGCNNERQSFAKLSYSTIDNVSINLLPAGAQRLECDDDSKQAVGVLPKSNSPLGYSAANFLVPQTLAYEDAKMQLFVANDELAHHAVGISRVTAEYLNTHFFSVFLFVYALQVSKALFCANVRKL